MSEKNSAFQTRLAVAQANAEVLKLYIPQMFSNPKIMVGETDSSDAGDFDEWKMSCLPPDVVLPLVGIKLIAKSDRDEILEDFTDLVLRSLVGVNGRARTDAVTIALGLGGGGGGRKSSRRPGWVGRHITDRNYKSDAEAKGEEVEE